MDKKAATPSVYPRLLSKTSEEAQNAIQAAKRAVLFSKDDYFTGITLELEWAKETVLEAGAKCYQANENEFSVVFDDSKWVSFYL